MHTRHYIIALIVIVFLGAGGAAASRVGSPSPSPSPIAASTASSARTSSPAPTSQASALPGGTCHARQVSGASSLAVLPDPACTPGALNPNVTQATIGSTICVSGYTKTIRPPVSVTDQLKAQSMTAYGFTDPISAHEEDHLVSLELGGAPADVKNLWAEPGKSPNPKDKLENQLHALVCSGKLPLATAQQAIATDWAQAYRTYVGGNP